MRFGVILICLFFLFGCVPPSQNQVRMENDLAKMKRRLAQLEVQQADVATTEVASGDTLQRQVAEVVAGLDTLRVDFQSINGRLDDLGHNNQQLDDDLRMTKEDLGLQIDALNSRVDQLEQLSGKLAEDIKVAPVSQPKPAAIVKPAETAEQLYQRALDKIRNKNEYAEGRALLEKFISTYPKHDLYVNALYWSGESLYGEKNMNWPFCNYRMLSVNTVITPKHRPLC